MNIEDIYINPNNPRYIRDERYQKLKKSIQEFPKMMKLRPIIVDDKGMILGGNMRYLAMVDLGYKEIPEGWVIKASELTEEERRKFQIVDNIPFGDWDYDILANEWNLEELQEWGIELPELEDIIKLNEKDDEIPEPPKEPKSKLGDLYQLGNHRLLCGDATKKEDIERLMDGKKADMVFTDPPYGINLIKKKSGKIGWNNLGKSKLYKSVIGDDVKFDPKLLLNMNLPLILFGANYYADLLPCKSGWLVWDKRTEETIHRTFADCELIWTSFNSPARIYRHLWDGMVRAGSRDEELKDRVHPTQKPVGLCTQILRDHKANSIFDPYGGSGSIMIACEKLNRICYMMEIDPIYIDVIIERWENYTGKKAVR